MPIATSDIYYTGPAPTYTSWTDKLVNQAEGTKTVRAKREDDAKPKGTFGAKAGGTYPDWYTNEYAAYMSPAERALAAQQVTDVKAVRPVSWMQEYQQYMSPQNMSASQQQVASQRQQDYQNAPDWLKPMIWNEMQAANERARRSTARAPGGSLTVNNIPFRGGMVSESGINPPGADYVSNPWWLFPQLYMPPPNDGGGGGGDWWGGGGGGGGGGGRYRPAWATGLYQLNANRG